MRKFVLGHQQKVMFRPVPEFLEDILAKFTQVPFFSKTFVSVSHDFPRGILFVFGRIPNALKKKNKVNLHLEKILHLKTLSGTMIKTRFFLFSSVFES